MGEDGLCDEKIRADSIFQPYAYGDSGHSSKVSKARGRMKLYLAMLAAARLGLS